MTVAVRIADTVFRPKTSTEWCQIVDSYYAARGQDGMVVHPNWVIYLPNKAGKPGVRVIVDVIPADPEEIAAAQADHAPAGLLEVADRAAQTGRGFKVLACLLDVTGCYTAAFIERCNTTPALQRRPDAFPTTRDDTQEALWQRERWCVGARSTTNGVVGWPVTTR